MPLIVPPVPIPEMNISTSPSVSFHISGPVVSKCIFGFAGFWNWLGIKALSIVAASSEAFSIAPFIPFAPSVSTTSAP